MPRRRKRHRSKHIASRRRKRVLFAGVSFLMLVVELGGIVPQARRQGLSLPASLELALLLWVCTVFAVWACLRSRRRRRSRDHYDHMNHEDYHGAEEESEDQEGRESASEDSAAAKAP